MLAAGRCAHEPAPQQQSAQRQHHPQEPQAATRPSDQPDREKQEADREPRSPSRPPRQGEPALPGLDCPIKTPPWQRRATSNALQRGARKLLKVDPRQVRHQVIKLTQAFRRIGLVQALLELRSGQPALPVTSVRLSRAVDLGSGDVGRRGLAWAPVLADGWQAVLEEDLADELASAVYADLVEDGLEVFPDCVGRDDQVPRYLAGRAATQDKADHLLFAAGESVGAGEARSCAGAGCRMLLAASRWPVPSHGLFGS